MEPREGNQIAALPVPFRFLKSEGKDLSQHPPISFELLEPVFVKFEERSDGIYQVQTTLADCMGVRFLCPLCLSRNDFNKVGVHSIVCWSSSRGTPPDAAPGPGRWALFGTGANDLTLKGDNSKSDSIDVKGGCCWHGFITNGLATSA